MGRISDMWETPPLIFYYFLFLFHIPRFSNLFLVNSFCYFCVHLASTYCGQLLFTWVPITIHVCRLHGAALH